MALILSWPQYVKLAFTFLSNNGHDYGYRLGYDVYRVPNLREFGVLEVGRLMPIFKDTMNRISARSMT